MMRNRTSVFFDTADSVRKGALRELFEQSDEFELQDVLDDSQPPSVILLQADNEQGHQRLGRRHWRRFKYCPLIVLAGPLHNSDDIEAFTADADDIINEPFRLRDLISRMRLQVRNCQWLASTPARIGSLTFLPVERLVSNSDGESVILSTLETRLLHHLYRASGKPVSRSLLLKEVWGYGPSVDTTTVQTHVHRIRHKLRTLDSEADFIITKGGSYGLAPTGSET